MNKPVETIFYSDGSFKLEFIENNFDTVEENLEKGWYYFDDETLKDVTGPFLSKQEAKKHQKKYNDFLNSHPKVLL